MSSSLQTVREDLQAALRTVAPVKWRVDDALKVTGQQSTPVFLVHQFTGVKTEVGAGTLPVGYLGATFALTLASSGSDLIKGITTINAALPLLLRGLATVPDLEWSDATYEVLDTGESVYRLPITVLCTY